MASSSVVVDAERDQADALGFLAVDRLAEQEIVFGLGHAAEQGPDDAGVIAGGDAEAGVAVDDLAFFEAIETSARMPATRPAPTAAPRMVLTIGLEQLITL